MTSWTDRKGRRRRRSTVCCTHRSSFHMFLFYLEIRSSLFEWMSTVPGKKKKRLMDQIQSSDLFVHLCERWKEPLYEDNPFILSLKKKKRVWFMVPSARDGSFFTLISVFACRPAVSDSASILHDRHIRMTCDGQTRVREEFGLLIRNFQRGMIIVFSAITEWLMKNKGLIPNSRGKFSSEWQRCLWLRQEVLKLVVLSSGVISAGFCSASQISHLIKVSALRASSSRSSALITSSLSHLYVRLMHFWSQALEGNRSISPSKRCRIPPHPTVAAYNVSPSPPFSPGLWFQSERSATGPASLLFRHRPESKHINRTFVFHLTEDTFKKKMEISSLGRASLQSSSFNLVLFSCFYSSSSSAQLPPHL